MRFAPLLAMLMLSPLSAIALSELEGLRAATRTQWNCADKRCHFALSWNFSKERRGPASPRW